MKKIFGLVLTAALVLSTIPLLSATSLTPPNEILITPSQTEAAEGDTIEIIITTNPLGIYALSYFLVFDPDVFELDAGIDPVTGVPYCIDPDWYNAFFHNEDAPTYNPNFNGLPSESLMYTSYRADTNEGLFACNGVTVDPLELDSDDWVAGKIYLKVKQGADLGGTTIYFDRAYVLDESNVYTSDDKTFLASEPVEITIVEGNSPRKIKIPKQPMRGGSGDVSANISIMYDGIVDNNNTLKPGYPTSSILLNAENNTNSSKNVNLIMGLYDIELKLIKLEYFTYSLAGSASDTFIEGINIPNNAVIGRLMVWDSLTNMTPYCEPLELVPDDSLFPNKIIANQLTMRVITSPGGAVTLHFRPKYSGIHSLIVPSGFTAVVKDSGGNVVNLSTTELIYPKAYTVEVTRDINTPGGVVIMKIGIEKTNNRILSVDTGNGVYYTNAGDGKLYKHGISTPLTAHPVYSLCANSTTLFYGSENKIYKLSLSGGLPVIIADVKAFYLSADTTDVFFANWTDGGKIYKVPIAGNANPALVCKDIGSRLYLNGNYVYYNNDLKNGALYSILKTANGTSGDPVI